ncbi:MAG: phosphoserine transaminase, partial [Hyphomonadaceae bacterium]|nr:phosphoserine transaminase [Hyphomonadaceae bacterium]
VGIVPASDTGAVEMCMWSMLGLRPVDIFAWESFGKDWVTDAQKQLRLKDCEIHVGDYGVLPDFNQAREDADIVFTWNGTTSGVRVDDHSWITPNPDRVVICDATSAVFAQDIPFEKLDVITFSWQKVLGGEAAHGMLILSPNAVRRLETYVPDRPLPKIFRMTKGGKLNEGIFEGATINTPSMLCVEDYLKALDWAESLGGVEGLKARSDASLSILEDWVARTDYIDFLCADAKTRSNTGVTFKFTDPRIAALAEDDQKAFVKKLVSLLETEGVAYDFNAYRDAPPGLRIWCGSTVEPSDVEKLTPWIDWAFAQLVETL